MNQIDKLMQNVDTPLIAAVIAALITIITFVYSKRKEIKQIWDYMYNRRKTKEELFAMVAQNQEDIKATQEEMKQYVENRIHDREQSFCIQKELIDAQQKISESVAELSRKLDVMQTNTDQRFHEEEERNNKRIRAELKDRISQTYRYHHSLQQINDMELEALEDLIEEYESAKGENSFVHSVVQKEMYTWERIERK